LLILTKDTSDLAEETAKLNVTAPPEPPTPSQPEQKSESLPPLPPSTPATPPNPLASSAQPQPMLSPLTIQQAQQTALRLELGTEPRTVTFISLSGIYIATQLFEQITTKIHRSNVTKRPIHKVAAHFDRNVAKDGMVIHLEAGDELSFECVLQMIAAAPHWSRGRMEKLVVPVEVFLAEE